MKKSILFFIFIFIFINANSQIIIDSISKFETTNYDKVSLPIIKAHSQFGDVLFLIDCGSNFSMFDMYFFNGKAHYSNISDDNSIEFSSINSSFKLSYNMIRVNINDLSYIFIHTSLYGLNEAIKEYKIVGILGNDWLKLNKAVINYKNRTLVIESPNINNK